MRGVRVVEATGEDFLEGCEGAIDGMPRLFGLLATRWRGEAPVGCAGALVTGSRRSDPQRCPRHEVPGSRPRRLGTGAFHGRSPSRRRHRPGPGTQIAAPPGQVRHRSRQGAGQGTWPDRRPAGGGRAARPPTPPEPDPVQTPRRPAVPVGGAPARGSGTGGRRADHRHHAEFGGRSLPRRRHVGDHAHPIPVGWGRQAARIGSWRSG